ncbi:hypothetical protein [Deinococcus sp. PEB2-63]
MLNFDRMTYVLTLLMACSLGVAVAMGWWLNCVLTVACLGHANWVAYRRWQAERRAAEARAQEEDARMRQTLDMQREILALCQVLTEQYPAVSTAGKSVRADN